MGLRGPKEEPEAVCRALVKRQGHSDRAKQLTVESAQLRHRQGRQGSGREPGGCGYCETGGGNYHCTEW